MRRIIPLALSGLLLAAAPAFAQTAEDPNTDPELEVEAAVEGEPAGEEQVGEEQDAQGNFSRKIPEGLKANLSEEELADYQARLDEAATPQERNEVRRELQRMNQERHLEKVQVNKTEKAKQKGFFESLTADFNDVVSGKAARDAKAARGKDGASGGKDKSSRGGGKDRGGKDRGSRGGKGGGGKNK